MRPNGLITVSSMSKGTFVAKGWRIEDNYLWELSLDNEFTSQNLPVTGSLKPESVPDTSGAVLWRNKAGTELYLFGGAYNLVQNLTTPNFQESSMADDLGL
jgi:hypothetical protein